MPAVSETSHGSKYSLAVAYAALSDNPHAQDELDRAIAERWFFLDFIGCDPDANGLLRAAVQELMPRMNFTAP